MICWCCLFIFVWINFVHVISMILLLLSDRISLSYICIYEYGYFIFLVGKLLYAPIKW